MHSHRTERQQPAVRVFPFFFSLARFFSFSIVCVFIAGSTLVFCLPLFCFSGVIKIYSNRNKKGTRTLEAAGKQKNKLCVCCVKGEEDEEERMRERKGA